MRRSHALAVLSLLAALLGSGACGADAAKPADCSAAEYRQFDFWVGDWEVYDTDGKLQGHNLVEKVYGSCVIQENWHGVEGGTGSSFNIYDASRKLWNETWVSSHGYFLSMDGYLRGKDMVMLGTHLDADGHTELHRGVWTPTNYGVHQTWEVSADGGHTWTMRFEGVLRRAAARSGTQ